jgi:hypothetical protein
MNAVDQEAGRRKNAPSLREVAFAATASFGLVSAWLFHTGWSYIYGYLHYFSVEATTLEVPKEHFLIYGSLAVLQFRLWFLAVAVVLIAGMALWKRLVRSGLVKSWLVRSWLGFAAGPLKVPLGAVALLAVFWLGHQVGVAAARRQMDSDVDNGFIAFNRIQVWRKDIATPLPDDSPWVHPGLSRGCYRLIQQNQYQLFLVRPVKGVPAGELPLVVLPWIEVQTMRVLSGDTSCSP